MNVVHVITDLFDGGAEAVLYRLIGETRHEVHHRVIVLMDGAKYGPMIEALGVRVDALEMSRGRITLRGLGKLFGLLRDSNADVVQTWMYHGDLVGGVAARLAGCSTVAWGIHHTDLDPDTTSKSTRLVARACAALSRMVPRRIVSCSAKGVAVHLGIGYADKFMVVANGYDTGAFALDEVARMRLRTEWKLGVETPLVGMVGRWHPQKDHLNFLKALALVRKIRPDVRCVLAGSGCGPQDAGLREMIQDLQLGEVVRPLGPRNDIPDVMNALDLHILSSAFGEAFPNVVAEAMACGTPCVVTEIGDAPLIVGNTGMTVPPRDEFALAAAIGSLLNERDGDPVLWQARRMSSRERIVENFSLARMACAYQDVWKELTERRT